MSLEDDIYYTTLLYFGNIWSFWMRGEYSYNNAYFKATFNSSEYYKIDHFYSLSMTHLNIT